MVTIYMPLLIEGTDVWRPVQATLMSGGNYRVEGHATDDEQWAFAPGTIVRCAPHTFSGGETGMVAVGPFD